MCLPVNPDRAAHYGKAAFYVFNETAQRWMDAPDRPRVVGDMDNPTPTIWMDPAVDPDPPPYLDPHYFGNVDGLEFTTPMTTFGWPECLTGDTPQLIDGSLFGTSVAVHANGYAVIGHPAALPGCTAGEAEGLVWFYWYDEATNTWHRKLHQSPTTSF